MFGEVILSLTITSNARDHGADNNGPIQITEDHLCQHSYQNIFTFASGSPLTAVS